MVVDADANENGSFVELARGGCEEEEEEEGGGDETEQGEVSSDEWAAMGIVLGSCGTSEGGAGSQPVQGASGLVAGEENLSDADVRCTLRSAAILGVGSTDDGSVGILLVDASAAPAGGISPAIRFGESDGRFSDGRASATAVVPGGSLIRAVDDSPAGV